METFNKYTRNLLFTTKTFKGSLTRDFQLQVFSHISFRRDIRNFVFIAGVDILPVLLLLAINYQ
jgi:hypothetical protein